MDMKFVVIPPDSKSKIGKFPHKQDMFTKENVFRRKNICNQYSIKVFGVLHYNCVQSKSYSQT